MIFSFSPKAIISQKYWLEKSKILADWGYWIEVFVTLFCCQIISSIVWLSDTLIWYFDAISIPCHENVGKIDTSLVRSFKIGLGGESVLKKPILLELPKLLPSLSFGVTLQ